MFTGIVQAVGEVINIEAQPRYSPDGVAAHRLDVDLTRLADNLAAGASIAVNGVCLTLAGREGSVGSFDVVAETWQRTTLNELRPGARVNLERSLRVGDPLDGHFVQGHVEGIGTVDRLLRQQGQWELWVRVDAGLMPAIIPKGSIAIDGTSLTVVEVGENRFSVVLVPTTLQCTVLGQRRPGDHVNIETDVLARLVVYRLGQTDQRGGAEGQSTLTWDRLRQAGFIA